MFWALYLSYILGYNPRKKDKAPRLVCLSTPYMSGMVYASTVPPVVVISYLMWYRYSSQTYLNARTYLLTCPPTRGLLRV
jgi:hypothetical protein